MFHLLSSVTPTVFLCFFFSTNFSSDLVSEPCNPMKITLIKPVVHLGQRKPNIKCATLRFSDHSMEATREVPTTLKSRLCKKGCLAVVQSIFCCYNKIPHSGSFIKNKSLLGSQWQRRECPREHCAGIFSASDGDLLAAGITCRQ